MFLKELPSPIMSASLMLSLTHSSLTHTHIIAIKLLLLRWPLTSVLPHYSNLILVIRPPVVDIADHAWNTSLSRGLHGATSDFSQENRSLSSVFHIWRFLKFILFCFNKMNWKGRHCWSKSEKLLLKIQPIAPTRALLVFLM